MEIGQIADELKLLATSGTRVPGVRKKVLVDIDKLVTLGDELRQAMPANMREADEVIRQKESIINLAMLEAQRIKTDADSQATSVTTAAQQEHQSKVDESEIVKVAESKGQEIKEEAMYEAQQIVQDAQKRAYRIMNEAENAVAARRDGADQYAREVLFNLEEELADTLGQVRRGIDALKIEAEASQQSQKQNNNAQTVPA
jgi:hypothetical protein